MKYSWFFYLVGNKNQIKLNFNKFTAVSGCSCYFYSIAEIRLTRILLVYVVAKSTYEREVLICTIKACGGVEIHLQGEWRYISTPPHRGELSVYFSDHFVSAQHSLNRRLGAPQSQSGHIREEENIFPLLGD